MGLSDPRTFGSKNPGATNVLRSGNKSAAIVTLLLDAVKGLLPVLLVKWFGKPYGLEDGTIALVGLAAFLGHLWPVFFRFQGGKGVATFIGVVFGIDCGAGPGHRRHLAHHRLLLPLLVAGLAGRRPCSRRPTTCWAIAWPGTRRPPIALALVAMAALLAYRHRENITRLLQGKESRLGAKKA